MIRQILSRAAPAKLSILLVALAMLASIAGPAVAASGELEFTGITTVDSDDDGVSDERDAFPNDPERVAERHVSAGGLHTCNLTYAGAITCWGNNAFGGAPAAPVGTFTAVSAGQSHTCGLEADGTITCWGSAGATTTPPEGTFTTIDSGINHSCGVRDNGTVACWGADTAGQLSAPMGMFVAVGAGLYHSCGLTGEAAIVCWGSDNYGQSSPPAGTFTAVSTGDFHTCGLKEGGTVACWGNDTVGPGQSSPPAGTFTAVSSGSFFNCALKTDGGITCWGGNEYKQSTPPTGTFVSITAGGYHACALKSDGSIACWGYKSTTTLAPPDTDRDGVQNHLDEFPSDPTETTDSDGDGIGDNADAFDDDPTETTDTDGDGTGDNADAFDDDPNETTDTDGDGVGDNADNCLGVSNPDQADTDPDDQGDLCEERHKRAITLTANHVWVDGAKKLKLSGNLSVADTAAKCIRNRRVVLTRYNPRTNKWAGVGDDTTNRAGRYVYKAPDISAKYRAKVKTQGVNYDGFRSSCSATSATKNHKH